MMTRFVRYVAVALCFSFLSCACAFADTTPGGDKPAFEWTKIQDLKPDGRATNRPVKQKWAVVVGASKFKEKRLDGDEQLMDKAARDFYAYLTDEHGGRFAPSHVKLLLNAEATRQNIMAALGPTWLGSLAGPDDLVVVFYSSSSFPTTDGGTYLCAYDCALDNIYTTCISMQDLMGTLKKDVKSDRILLVLQACYSGAAELGSKALYSGYNLDLEKVSLGKGYVILSSSGPDEMTYNDVFSRHLIEALRQQNGLVPLRAAFASAKKATQEETGKLAGHNKKQTPVIKTDWQGNDLVVGTPPVEQVSALPDGVINYLSAESYYLKATNLANDANFNEAIPQYEKAIAIDPTYADALADYGAILAIKNKLPEAQAQYEKAVNVRPDDGLFHANYARILDRLGKSQEAVVQLEQAYRCSPKDRVVLLALSTKDMTSGNAQRAVRLLKEAAALYPNVSKVRERLSYALAKTGETDAALAEAKEAVKLDPKAPSALLNLGSILMLHGDKTAAMSAYKEALTVAPDYADAHFLLSRALEANGDKGGALSELELFLQHCSSTDPRLVVARKHLSQLSSVSGSNGK
jgi:tetratricopeptide (TPR) repeat protein